MGCDNIPHIIIIYVYFKTTSSRVSLEGLAPQDIPPSDEVGKMGVLQYIFPFFNRGKIELVMQCSEIQNV